MAGNNNQSSRVKIGAVWEGSANGKPFFTGQMGSARLEIWPNGFKNSPNQPDFIVYVSTPEKKDTQNNQQDNNNQWGSDGSIPF